jgi:hypothetical protein
VCVRACVRACLLCAAGLGAERVDGEVVLRNVRREGLQQVVQRLAHRHLHLRLCARVLV